MDSLFTNAANCVIGSKVEYFEETESTNSLATVALKAGEKEGVVYIADYQTKGRGQRGNFWESTEGKNLTFSVLTYPATVEVFDHFYLSMVVANGIVEALSAFSVPAKVKWPNDIYFNDYKIAGILIENGLMGTRITSSIWGIGLNVNQEQFFSPAPNPSSMKLITGEDFERDAVLNAILVCMDKWYGMLKRGDLAAIDSYYFESLYRREGLYEYDSEQYGRFMARIKSVEHTGELVLETEKGELRSFAFKEVSFII